MKKLKDFYNEGFGWVCRRCARKLTENEDPSRSRLLSEGEAESKHPRLSTPAIASWADKARTTLMCPKCGVIEKIE